MCGLRHQIRYYRLSVEEKERIIGKLRRILMEDEEVVFAYIHGGFTRRELFRDIDVALWLKDENKAFHYMVKVPVKIQLKLGVSIPVDIQVLNNSPLPFRYHVFTQGKLLYSRDEKLRQRIVNETIRQYLDLKERQKHVTAARTP